MDVKLLIVQLEPIPGDIDKNIQKVRKLLSETNDKFADLIIMPELWTTGWDCPSFNKYSENLYKSKTLAFLKELAIEYNSNVIGGSAILSKNNEKDRNTCIILNRNGDIIDTYDKFHLFSLRGQSEGTYLEEGDTPVIVNTDVGRIGISICYDIRFPEMFRLYALNGADFMVNMAAWPKWLKYEYKTLALARAIENQIFFISCCLTGKANDEFDFSGESCVINYRGNIIASLQDEEKVLPVVINLDTMKQYRESMPILNDTKKQYCIMER